MHSKWESCTSSVFGVVLNKLNFATAIYQKLSAVNIAIYYFQPELILLNETNYTFSSKRSFNFQIFIRTTVRKLCFVLKTYSSLIIYIFTLNIIGIGWVDVFPEIVWRHSEITIIWLRLIDGVIKTPTLFGQIIYFDGIMFWSSWISAKGHMRALALMVRKTSDFQINFGQFKRTETIISVDSFKTVACTIAHAHMKVRTARSKLDWFR